MTRTLLTGLVLTLAMAPAAFANPVDAPIAFLAADPAVVPATSIGWFTLTPAPLAPVQFATPAKARKRPTLLTSLYLSEGAFQAYDFYSTRKALAASGVEANPVMRQLVSNTGAFAAVKIGVAAGTIGAAEYLWRHDHRAQAIVVMVISNGLMGVVAQHNASVLAKLR